MDGRRLGSLIGAIGGLVFVLVNAGDLPAGTWLRVGGVVLFVATLVAIVRTSAPAPARPSASAMRIYWACVLAEVAAIPLGALVLNRLDHPELVLVWVVLVLGLHFIPFARAFAQPLFGYLGALLVLVALVGGASSLAGADRANLWTAVIAGFALLTCALGGLIRPSS